MEAAQREGASAPPVQQQLPYTDALPYYDREIESVPDMRERVEQEIEAEKQKMRYDPTTLLPPAYELHGPLAEEIARAQREEKLDALDASRYQLPAPTKGLKAPEEEWAQSVQNAEVQLAYMDGRYVRLSRRLKNIELLRRYGRAYLDLPSKCMALAQL